MLKAGTLALAVALLPMGMAVHASAQDSRSRTSDSSSETARLRRSIDALTREVELLRDQMAATAANDMARFNANAARLQLVLNDIDRLKKERAELEQRLLAAQGRENEALEGLANIQNQLILSGEINRTAAEERIRTALNRQLEQARDEEYRIQGQIDPIEATIERREQLADTLRRRLKIDDSQIDVVEEPPPPRRATTEERP